MEKEDLCNFVKEPVNDEILQSNQYTRPSPPKTVTFSNSLEDKSHGTDSPTLSHEGISSLKINHLKECQHMSPSSSSTYGEITPNVNEELISKFNSISTSPSFEDSEINTSSSNIPSTSATVNLPLTGVNSTLFASYKR